jgi:hypothetical protein
MTPESHWNDVQPAPCSAGWRDRYGQLDGNLAGPPTAGASDGYWLWIPSRYPDQANGALRSAPSSLIEFADRFRRHGTPRYEQPAPANGRSTASRPRYSGQTPPAAGTLAHD